MREIAKAITAGMSALYGQKFRAQWPTLDGWKAAIIEWAKSCRPYGTKAVENAIGSLKCTGSAWPPSLPEFLDVVREANRPEQITYVSLPRPLCDRSIAEQAISAMRGMLR